MSTGGGVKDSFGVTKSLARATAYGASHANRFRLGTQGPIEGMAGAALALGAGTATAASFIGGATTNLAGSVLNGVGLNGNRLKSLFSKVNYTTPAEFGWAFAKGSARVAGAMSNAYTPFTRGLNKANTDLLKTWEPSGGARKVLGGAAASGALFGVAAASFKFNREVADEAVARAQEGSAYEAGPSSFGSGSTKLPYTSGRQVFGMHNAR